MFIIAIFERECVPCITAFNTRWIVWINRLWAGTIGARGCGGSSPRPPTWNLGDDPPKLCAWNEICAKGYSKICRHFPQKSSNKNVFQSLFENLKIFPKNNNNRDVFQQILQTNTASNVNLHNPIPLSVMPILPSINHLFTCIFGICFADAAWTPSSGQ